MPARASQVPLRSTLAVHRSGGCGRNSRNLPPPLFFSRGLSFASVAATLAPQTPKKVARARAGGLFGGLPPLVFMRALRAPSGCAFRPRGCPTLRGSSHTERKAWRSARGRRRRPPGFSPCSPRWCRPLAPSGCSVTLRPLLRSSCVPANPRSVRSVALRSLRGVVCSSSLRFLRS